MNVDAVWRYKHYIAIIEACDKIINEEKDCELRLFAKTKRADAFAQLLDFQIAFNSGD